MDIIKQITQNYILVVALAGWFAAQLIKIIIDLFKSEFHWERLVGAGGMPSSHSALVTSMTVAVAQKAGIGSGVFAIAFTLSVIVMYDAMGVRRAAGEQAKIINRMMKEKQEQNITKEEKEVEKIDQQLKEYLGHTPLEVLSGIVVGLVVGCLFQVL